MKTFLQELQFPPFFLPSFLPLCLALSTGFFEAPQVELTKEENPKEMRNRLIVQVPSANWLKVFTSKSGGYPSENKQRPTTSCRFQEPLECLSFLRPTKKLNRQAGFLCFLGELGNLCW